MNTRTVSPLCSSLTLALVAVLSTACATGANASGSGSSFSKRMGGPTPGASTQHSLLRQAELEGALIVPPDRARAEGYVLVVVEGTRAKAAAKLDDWLKRFTNSVGRVPGCEATVVHKSLPKKNGDAGARQEGYVVVEVALQGLSTVQERVNKVARCAAVVEDMPSDYATKRSREGTYFSLQRGWTLSVDRPASHLPELLRRASEPFAAMEGQALARQIRPQDRRCVPTGRVTSQASTYAGIWLEAELDCDVVPPAPAQQKNHAP